MHKLISATVQPIFQASVILVKGAALSLDVPGSERNRAEYRAVGPSSMLSSELPDSWMVLLAAW